MIEVYEVGGKNHIEKLDWKGNIDPVTVQLAGFEITGKYDSKIFVRRKTY